MTGSNVSIFSMKKNLRSLGKARCCRTYGNDEIQTYAGLSRMTYTLYDNLEFVLLNPNTSNSRMQYGKKA